MVGYGTGTRSFSSSNQFKTTTISESLGCLRNRSAEVSASKIRDPSGVMSWFRMSQATRYEQTVARGQF